MYNILVTGVGSIIGYGIIKSLRAQEYPVKVIGMDIYDDAFGRTLCDKFIQAKYASDPCYCDFLSNLIIKEKIDLVIPGIEQDINRIVKEKVTLDKLDAKFVLNNIDLISISEDKWITTKKLLESGFPAINSFLDGEFDNLSSELGCPMLLKPRRSYASKGILNIENKTDFEYWKNKLKDNFMVQEIIGDDENEYTVGAFGYGDGNCSKKIILKRKLSGEGATSKATVIEHYELSKIIDKMANIFKPIGPTNFQFRYHKGQFLLLEINPRISSSTSLRTAFGYNEAKMCIEYFLQNKIPTEPEIKVGSAVRYIEDCVSYASNNI